MVAHWKKPKEIVIKQAFRYFITMPALQKYRERVESAYAGATDEALARVLDDRIHAAIQAGRWIDVEEMNRWRGNVARVVKIADLRLDYAHDHYVLLHPSGAAYQRPQISPFGPDDATDKTPAVVTIMSQESGQNALATKRWREIKRGDGEPVAREVPPVPKTPPTLAVQPFAVLRSVPIVPAPPPPPAQESEDTSMSKPTSKPTRPKQAAKNAQAALAALPDGWKQPARVHEREEFIRAIFVKEPWTTTTEANTRCKARFAVGLSGLRTSELRNEVREAAARGEVVERTVTIQPLPAPPAPPVVVAPPVVAAPIDPHPIDPPALIFARAAVEARDATARVEALRLALAQAEEAERIAKSRADELLRAIK